MVISAPAFAEKPAFHEHLHRGVLLRQQQDVLGSERRHVGILPAEEPPEVPRQVLPVTRPLEL